MYKENKNAVDFGLAIGVINCSIQVAVYYLAPHLMGEFAFGIITLLVSLGLYLFFTIRMRKNSGEYWPFKTAVKSVFLMSLVAVLFTTIFNYGFYNYVEPNAYENVIVYVSNSLEKAYTQLGLSREEIDMHIKQSSLALKDQFSPTIADSIRNIAIACIMQFILSLIFAAIFKKNEPIIIEIDESQIR